MNSLTKEQRVEMFKFFVLLMHEAIPAIERIATRAARAEVTAAVERLTQADDVRVALQETILEEVVAALAVYGISLPPEKR